MSRLMQHVRVLADDIGPRGPTTEAERRAAGYVAAEMGRWASEVRVEPFRSHTTFSWPWILIYAVVTAGGLLLWWAAGWALAVGAAGLLLLVGQTRDWIDLGRLFRQRPSQNVVGIVQPRGAVRQRLVVAGHMDTQRALLIYHPSRVGTFRPTYLLGVASAVTIPLLALLALLIPGWRYWPWASLPFLINQLASIGLLVHGELFMAHVPGANDNASGVAATLGVGETLAREPLAHTEVWCLVTGCEEAEMVGMKRFLDRYGGALRDAYFVVLDNHGAGQVKFITAEGMLGLRRCDNTLVQVASEVAAAHPQWKVAHCCNTLAPTDAGPCLARGFRAIHIRAEDEKGLLPNWHWYTDTSDNIDPGNLEVAAGMVLAMAQALDARTLPESPQRR